MNTLETPRLILRKFTPADLDRFAELSANPDLMRFSSKGAMSRSDAIALFNDRILAAGRVGKPTQFAVIPRETGQAIGYCGFFLQMVDDVEELEIAYRLLPDYWGRGIATEAARAVRDHAFGDLEAERVISIIHPENHASQRVAEKNGLTVEKETQFRGFDVLIYALSRQEWLAARGAE